MTRSASPLVRGLRGSIVIAACVWASGITGASAAQTFSPAVNAQYWIEIRPAPRECRDVCNPASSLERSRESAAKAEASRDGHGPRTTPPAES